MTKDYAHPTKRRRLHPTRSRVRAHNESSRKTPSSFIPAWAWMSIGLILGVAISATIYWKSHSSTAEQVTQLNTNKVTNSKKSRKKSVSLALDEARSRFDFYTLLPNLSTEAAETAETATEAKTAVAQSAQPKDFTPITASTLAAKSDLPPIAASLPAGTAAYIIQAGSFKQQGPAERLKAKLMLEGFEARIQTVSIGEKETWYRVYVGPFASIYQAQYSQKKLEQAERRHSVVLKMRV